METKIYGIGIVSIVFLLYACGEGSVSGPDLENPEPVPTANGNTLQPVSGSDGEFEVIEADGVRFYRSVKSTKFPVTYMYFQYNSEVKNRTVYVRILYKDNGTGTLNLQYNSTGNDYEAADAVCGVNLGDTQGLRIAVFELPFADFRSAQNLEPDLRIFSSGDEQMHIFSASLSFDNNFELLTPASTFNMDSRIVSTTVFHWYVPNGGQLTGPWRPVEGREN